MRHLENPTYFKTSHWKTLWMSKVSDFDELKKVAATSAFVAIDTEGWGRDTREVAEIGLSFMALDFSANHTNSVSFNKALPTLPTLHDLVDHYRIRTRCIRVAGRVRDMGIREAFEFGNEDDVTYLPAEEIGTAIALTLASFKKETKRDLVLVGFAPCAEFRAISIHYSVIAEYFSSWVDLQEVVREVAGINFKPSMRKTLIGLGFEHDRAAVPVDRKRKHNAGNDTVRMLRILVSLLHLSKPAQLHITKTKTPGATHVHKVKFWNGMKPKPREVYPFIAIMKLVGYDLSGVRLNGLRSNFLEYSPVAVGISANKKYGWVCLPSLDVLDEFVRDVDGRRDPEGREWSVRRDYDPAITEAWTAEEYSERKRLQEKGDMEQKQAERKAWREERESDELALDELGLGLDIGGDDSDGSE